jgi:hypothetical protein
MQGRHGDGERLRRRSGDDTDRDPERGLPGLRDQMGERKQRLEQLVEAGHLQARLRGPVQPLPGKRSHLTHAGAQARWCPGEVPGGG